MRFSRVIEKHNYQVKFIDRSGMSVARKNFDQFSDSSLFQATPYGVTSTPLSDVYASEMTQATGML